MPFMLCGLEDRGAFFYRYFFIVYRQFDHLCYSPFFVSRLRQCNEFCRIPSKPAGRIPYRLEFAGLITGPAMDAELLDDLVRLFLFSHDRFDGTCPETGAASFAKLFVYPEGGQVAGRPLPCTICLLCAIHIHP